MSLELFIPLLIATVVLLATPGPTILLVVSHALAQGRGVALAVVGGVILGDLVAMSATLLGLGVILATSAALFTAMKWAGAAYLAWMGWRMIRSAGAATADLAEVTRKSRAAAFRDSALVTVLNPKSIGFFIAFVPQFLDPAAPAAPQFTVMIASFVGLGGLNALAYALLAGQLRRQITRPAILAWLQRVGGAVLIGMAAFTATLRRV
ncbi:MAG: LysE family translocator [Pseudomonadota bacterium]|nr:LysE family translocator [Pseudomonadota bacterium]